jgi:hypothetical protein
MVNDGLSDFADSILDLIQKKFGNSENEIRPIYERQMNSLVKSVLVFHPCFLEKKVIPLISKIITGGPHLLSTQAIFRIPLIKEKRDL